MTESPNPQPPTERQHWMGVLARADIVDLERALSAHPDVVAAVVRRPEVGLIMVRGRAGGDGSPFALGEAPVTRCAVTIDGRTGHGYVLGRSPRKAEIAAIFDALFQDPKRGPARRRAVIPQLVRRETERRAEQASRAAATKVEFFTMVRGA
jgi:alpha-D-ribose 1-methylphosphonate 5-triphosphate synthase subunit PhnG